MTESHWHSASDIGITSLEVALHGPAQDLAKDARVIDTYLGAARKPAAEAQGSAA